MTHDFHAAFHRLSTVLRAYGEALITVTDVDDELYYDTPHVMNNRKNLFFGAVQIKKSYVSYHLMPVYVFPELLESISPTLRKRMQGKSCFNFKTVDEELFEELEKLTESGFHRYRMESYV